MEFDSFVVAAAQRPDATAAFGGTGLSQQMRTLGIVDAVERTHEG